MAELKQVPPFLAVNSINQEIELPADLHGLRERKGFCRVMSARPKRACL